MKLALGTVQFGCDYGISNSSGKVPLVEVEKMLNYCKDSGILTLDTAQGYGKSEEVLGQFNLTPFRIITKIMGSLYLEKSLENLKLSKVYALMCHREDELNDLTMKKYEAYKSQGLVEKLGVSVYSPTKLEEILKNYNIEIVQIPLNLLDQRFLPLLPKLKDQNIEVHTRSSFLQGLLLMETTKIHSYFNDIKDILDKIEEVKLDTCLNFLKNIKNIDNVVIGCSSFKELQEITTSFNNKAYKQDYIKFSVKNEKFINPSKWEI